MASLTGTLAGIVATAAVAGMAAVASCARAGVPKHRPAQTSRHHERREAAERPDGRSFVVTRVSLV
jgi:hypothetical protein